VLFWSITQPAKSALEKPARSSDEETENKDADQRTKKLEQQLQREQENS
jgi:hypothetical protein